MPNKVKEKAETYSELEDEGSIWSLLITFVILVAVAALICTIVWKVTHKEAKTDLGKVQVPVSPSLTETLVAEDEITGQVSQDELDKEIDPINGDRNMEFMAVDDEVTAKDAAIIRIQPSTEGITTVAGQLKNGQILKRVGVNKETGWSKVIFNGQEGYAISYLLTTDKNYKAKDPEDTENRVTTSDGYVILFRECDELVTTQDSVSQVNLRTEPSIAQGSSTVSVQLKTGLTARRTGISVDSGWSRVEFNGLVLYVATYLLKEVSE